MGNENPQAQLQARGWGWERGGTPGVARSGAATAGSGAPPTREEPSRKRRSADALCTLALRGSRGITGGLASRYAEQELGSSGQQSTGAVCRFHIESRPPVPGESTGRESRGESHDIGRERPRGGARR